ncbi:ImmA/IrrE family metallo-endopeptidase [Allokutzneria oryzae]|uniref:ImmA/IrrE family metallo-endopeptidase n=1 Tax=Allokutzneria oryzae TaxID=1378989 RepID=A0ABV5ZWV4_9PSEU
MRGRYPEAAQEQARAMLAVLERDHPGAAERLRPHPIIELASWTDLRVLLVEEHSDGQGCSVSGSYHPELSPPTLLVGRSLSHRRRAFTALHELGHHLQQNDVGLGERTFDAEDPVRFQEEACDAFAAQVLLPDDQIRQRIGPAGPTARDVVDLYESSAASREACCVWAARHLTEAGAVVLHDAAGTVLFAAPRGFVPPARRSDQSDTPLVRAALRAKGPVEHHETFVRYRDGRTSSPLSGQAAWCGDDYVITVLRSRVASAA